MLPNIWLTFAKVWLKPVTSKVVTLEPSTVLRTDIFNKYRSWSLIWLGVR